MDNWIKALDISFSAVSRADVRCLQTELLIQCLWTAIQAPDVRVPNLQNAQAEGARTAGYISINGGPHNGAWHVDQARAGIPDAVWDALYFIAIDIELPGIRVEDILSACYRAQALGKPVVVYTSYNAWHTLVIPSNPSDVARAGFALWNGYWDQKEDVDYPGLRFGGWPDELVLIEQYSGDTNICSKDVDRDVWNKYRLLLYVNREQTPLPPEDEDMGFLAAVATDLTGKPIRVRVIQPDLTSKDFGPPVTYGQVLWLVANDLLVTNANDASARTASIVKDLKKTTADHIAEKAPPAHA